MRFQCSECGGIVAVDNSDAGTQVQCGHCAKVVTVPPTRVSPGAVIGDFIIQKEIGRGGMGVVYLAHQISLDRPAALKVLAEQYANNAEFVVGFIKEARAAAKLNHPHIVQAYAVGEDDGIFYFAMENIDGETMKSVLKKKQIIPVDQAIGIIQQIAEALNYAWIEQKLIHRDIKPDNIMLTSNGRAKLADLGLARVAGDIDDSEDDEVMGTPQYISPEHLTGAPMDVRSDIYSLGATFYHFVTGRFPFEGKTGAEIAKKHLTDPLVPPNQVNPAVPEAVAKIIEKMMAKDPIMRYQDAEALVDDLRIAKKLVEQQQQTSSTPLPRATTGPLKKHTGKFTLGKRTAETSASVRTTTTATGFSTKTSQVTATRTQDRLFSEDTLTEAIKAQKAKNRRPYILALAGIGLFLLIAGGITASIIVLSGGKKEEKKPVVVHEPKTSKALTEMNDILAFAAVNKRQGRAIHQKCEAFLKDFSGPKLKVEEKPYEELYSIYIRLDESILKKPREEAGEGLAKKLEEKEILLKDKLAREEKLKREAEERERKRQEEERIRQAKAAQLRQQMDELRARLPKEKAAVLTEVFFDTGKSKFKEADAAASDWIAKMEKLAKDNPQLAGTLNPFLIWGKTLSESLKAAQKIDEAAHNGGTLLAKMRFSYRGKKCVVSKIEDGKIYYSSGGVETRMPFEQLDAKTEVEFIRKAAEKVNLSEKLFFFHVFRWEPEEAKLEAAKLPQSAAVIAQDYLLTFRDILKEVWATLPEKQKKQLRQKFETVPELKAIVSQ